MLVFYTLIQILIAVDIVIVPTNTSQDKPQRYLTHNLRFTSHTDKQDRLLWSLEKKNKLYRIRYKKYYIGINDTKHIVMKNGGKSLTELDKISRINKLKVLVDVQKKAKKHNIDSEDSDNADDNIEEYTQTETTPEEDKKETLSSNYPIIPIESKSRSKLGNILLSDLKELVNTLSNDVKTTEIKQKSAKKLAFRNEEPKLQKKKLKNELTEENQINQDLETPKDVREKSEISGGSFLVENDMENLSSVKFSDLRKDIDTNSMQFAVNPIEQIKIDEDNKIKVSETKDVDVGYLYELVPVFNDRISRSILIVYEKNCLTHGMRMEPCSFDEYWSLPEKYLWEIYKTEDSEYLAILKEYIAKAEAGKYKKSVVANLNIENCMKCQGINPMISKVCIDVPKPKKKKNCECESNQFKPKLCDTTGNNGRLMKSLYPIRNNNIIREIPTTNIMRNNGYIQPYNTYNPNMSLGLSSFSSNEYYPNIRKYDMYNGNKTNYADLLMKNDF